LGNWPLQLAFLLVVGFQSQVITFGYMEHRAAILIVLTSYFLLPVEAQYRIVLERGDTIHAKEYYIKGDSLGFSGGKVAKRDVLCLTSGKQTYVFPFPSLGLKQFRLEPSERICERGELYAFKYARADLSTTEIHDPTIDSLGSEQWMACFRSRLMELGIDPDLGSGPIESVSSPVDITSPQMILVLRSGDTLSAPKGYASVNDTIRIVGGDRIPRSNVLMVVDLGGQHVFNERTGNKVKLRPQVRDLSPGALGVIYARIYWDSVNTTAEIPDLPETMRNHTLFSECFYTQQARAQNKKDTIQGISTLVSFGLGGVQGFQRATGTLKY